MNLAAKRQRQNSTTRTAYLTRPIVPVSVGATLFSGGLIDTIDRRRTSWRGMPYWYLDYQSVAEFSTLSRNGLRRLLCECTLAADGVAYLGASDRRSKGALPQRLIAER